jgi:signal peptidase
MSARKLLGWIEIALVLGFAVLWFLELRPQALGGPASYALVNGRSMLPKYRTGDIVIVHRQREYRVGQVVAYTVPKGYAGAGAQVIHRLTDGNGRTGFVVQGDNRTAPDIWHPKTADIVGSQWLHIPKAGAAVRLLHTPLFLGALAALIAIGSVLGHKPRKTAEAPAAVSAPPAAAPPPVPVRTASAGGAPTFQAHPGQRLMLALEGDAPDGVPTCSLGCHVLLHGARFDPHTGEPVPGAREATPPAAIPVEAFDFAELERELHEVVSSTAEVTETMRSLVAAVGEYGEHLRSHTAVMQALAETTDQLRAVTVEMRDVLAPGIAPPPPARPKVVLVLEATVVALIQWQQDHGSADQLEPLLRKTTSIVSDLLALATQSDPSRAQATALVEAARAGIAGDERPAARKLAAILFGAVTVLKSKRF